MLGLFAGAGVAPSQAAVETATAMAGAAGTAGDSAIPAAADAETRARFREAWQAAASGRRDRFDALGPALQDYVLYPYWRYEDLRHRRATVAPETMAEFLDAHPDWAFTPGLRTAWLRALGQRGRWSPLLRYGADVPTRNTELRCFLSRARLAAGDTAGLREEALDLWTVGRSQPDACDPLFAWLIDQDAVTPAVAWERIRLAMAAGNPRLTLYLARFLPGPDRTWLERWQRLDRGRYRRLERAVTWHDDPTSRMIAAAALRRLARLDAERALALYEPLSRHFDWDDETRGELAREVGLWAAVALEPGAIEFIRATPPAARDDQLHEWWARAAMAAGDWEQVLLAIEGLRGEAADDERWRYWRARALFFVGKPEAAFDLLEELATRTTYHGFLAADALRQPYTICALEPPVTERDIDVLGQSPRFHRALELHRAGLDNWAAAEWSRATRALPTDQLKVAAGLARREGWYDRAIFALGDSGELRFYDWRFPVLYTDSVMASAGAHDLDPAWIYGIMRSESAMTEHARSSAGALGLMQVLPATAKTLSRRHGLPYRASSQLLQGDVNIRFGTTYLRELLDEHGDNPVLVSGAYNAGPNAVKRWLGSRRVDEAALWIETLPYFETRDYIPRVLTFTTLYDWRLQNPVRRISSRMPGIESGTLPTDSTTEVVCRPEPAAVAVSGS